MNKELQVTVSRLSDSFIEELELKLSEIDDEYGIDDAMVTFRMLVVGYHAAWDHLESQAKELERLKVALYTHESYDKSVSELNEENEQLRQERDELKEKIKSLKFYNLALEETSKYNCQERDEARELLEEHKAISLANALELSEARNQLAEAVDKKKLIETLNESADMFYKQGDIVKAGLFVILRDSIEEGEYALSHIQGKESASNH